eukprot:tig00020563_g11321.t1
MAQDVGISAAASSYRMAAIEPPTLEAAELVVAAGTAWSRHHQQQIHAGSQAQPDLCLLSGFDAALSSPERIIVAATSVVESTYVPSNSVEIRSNSTRKRSAEQLSFLESDTSPSERRSRQRAQRGMNDSESDASFSLRASPANQSPPPPFLAAGPSSSTPQGLAPFDCAAVIAPAAIARAGAFSCRTRLNDDPSHNKSTELVELGANSKGFVDVEGSDADPSKKRSQIYRVFFDFDRPDVQSAFLLAAREEREGMRVHVPRGLSRAWMRGMANSYRPPKGDQDAADYVPANSITAEGGLTRVFFDIRVRFHDPNNGFRFVVVGSNPAGELFLYYSPQLFIARTGTQHKDLRDRVRRFAGKTGVQAKPEPGVPPPLPMASSSSSSAGISLDTIARIATAPHLASPAPRRSNLHPVRPTAGAEPVHSTFSESTTAEQAGLPSEVFIPPPSAQGEQPPPPEDLIAIPTEGVQSAGEGEPIQASVLLDLAQQAELLLSPGGRPVTL